MLPQETSSAVRRGTSACRHSPSLTGQARTFADGRASGTGSDAQAGDSAFLDRLKSELDLPIVYVTHALDEVTRLADDLLIMEQGRVEASGPVDEVLTRLDVPRMLGEEAGAVVEGTVTERDSQWQLLRVDFNGGHLWLRDSGEAIGQCARIRILARDVSLSLADEQASSILNRLPATVIGMADDTDRAMLLIRLAVGDAMLLARISKKSAFQLELCQNQRLWVQIKSVAVLH